MYIYLYILIYVWCAYAFGDFLYIDEHNITLFVLHIHTKNNRMPPLNDLLSQTQQQSDLETTKNARDCSHPIYTIHTLYTYNISIQA